MALKRLRKTYTYTSQEKKERRRRVDAHQ